METTNITLAENARRKVVIDTKWNTLQFLGKKLNDNEGRVDLSEITSIETLAAEVLGWGFMQYEKDNFMKATIEQAKEELEVMMAKINLFKNGGEIVEEVSVGIVEEVAAPTVDAETIVVFVKTIPACSPFVTGKTIQVTYRGKGSEGLNINPINGTVRFSGKPAIYGPIASQIARQFNFSVI